jgi:DNA primase
MYSQDLIDSLLKSSDIVTVISSYISVIKKGRSYVALCPFHDDKHPSLNISKEKQIFKCFSCGTGGNAITFIEKYEKISFDEAVRKLADLVGFHDPRLAKEAYKPAVNPTLEPLYKCINDLENYYKYGLSLEEGKRATDYLAARHIDQTQIARYGLGYAPMDGQKTVAFLQAKGHSLKSIEDIGIALAKASGTADSNAGRLIFPLANPDGQVVGFSARRLGEEDTAKYVNSPETKIFQKSDILYNYHLAKATAHHDGYVYLLEGFMDVMALEKAGMPSAVALMGTNLSANQVNLLRRLNCEVRLCLDGDAAGQEGMMRMISRLNKAALPFRIVNNPNDLRDPDDILQESGPEALRQAMGHLVDAFDFQLNYYINVKKLETPEDKKKAFYYFVPYLRNLPAGIERDNYIVKLARATGYEEEAIRQQIKIGPTNLSISRDEVGYGDMVQAEYDHPEKKYVKRLILAERETLYYMLINPDAVNYFEKSIDSFYDDLYNEIANYVVEYVDKRKKPVNVSELMGEMSNSGADNIDTLESKLIEISSDKIHPPFSQEELDACANCIKKEKDKLYDNANTHKSMIGKDPNERARIIAEYAKRRDARLKERDK